MPLSDDSLAPIPLAELDDWLARRYGLHGALSRLPGENQNVLTTAPDGTRHVLKLTPAADPPELVALEHAAAEAVAATGLGVPRLVPAASGRPMPTLTGPDGTAWRSRLYGFVGGTPWRDAGAPPAPRLRDAGRVVAGVQAALAPLGLPAGRRSHRWDLARAGELRASADAVPDAERRALARAAFALWAGAVPFLAELPRGLVHADLNDENLLVDGDRVVGVLDFGDALVSPYACDLAIALAYLLLDAPDPMAAGAEIVAGYHAVRALSARELEVLHPLACGRLAVSLAIAAERRRLDPGRAAWFATEARAWALLERLVAVPPAEAADRWAAPTGVPVWPERGDARERLAARRRARISGALSLSFAEPARFVRGRGQFLFDDEGLPFLDLYNNVCHVGHCHPHVVAAGQRQMARLNTNTRYLYDGLLDYADRIAATLPPALSRVFVVNSGSEANELALRLARAHTGRRDVVVLENAYHGHTQGLIDISPYKFDGPGGAGRPEWVHVAPMPDGYRGPFFGQGRRAGEAYGDAVGEVVAAMARPPAAFIAESLPSVGGQIVPPEGYFETALAHVRAAGGVAILDEVQVGFGRVGTHMWGFEQQGIVPDIVVMGKPIGNGHPLGVVVTTAAIAQSFADAGMEFFSTFGGNPVSCAVGLAVLDVVEREGLQAHALEVGTFLRDALAELMGRHPLIGDVRGTGLFIGVELVRDRATRAPATAAARALVDGLRRRRILTGTDGPFESVVKIKPPLPLSRDNAAAAVRAFDAVLTEIA